MNFTRLPHHHTAFLFSLEKKRQREERQNTKAVYTERVDRRRKAEKATDRKRGTKTKFKKKRKKKSKR